MEPNTKIVIAVDGHSSCGKSTMAKALAKKTGYIYIDSGAMYRAVTLFCIENGLVDERQQIDEEGLKARMNDIGIVFKNNPETGRNETWLNGRNVEQQIRSMEVSNLVSPVSALKFVRTAMTARQQSLGRQKGIVMDGRDIGTTVFPDAELKIFVTASAETRARRRWEELKGKGEEVPYEAVLDNVRQRDEIDQNRAESPLRKADDAILLDNSTFSPEEQNDWMYQQYLNALSKSAASHGKH